MKGYDFERCLVDVITERAERKGYKHKPLAIAAWPDRKDAGTKWRKIRNGQEPRGFLVQDAYDLAMAMGESFIEMCGLAQARLLDREEVMETSLVPEKNKNNRQPAQDPPPPIDGPEAGVQEYS